MFSYPMCGACGNRVIRCYEAPTGARKRHEAQRDMLNNYREAAKVDGATHYDVFIKIILPLSIPAFASIFILQFLWVWNDLLVGLVFLDKHPSEIILTAKLKELLGSRGENWEILTTGAFISMTVPLFIFFSLQRYFIRGLVAGSVKG